MDHVLQLDDCPLEDVAEPGEPTVHRRAQSTFDGQAQLLLLLRPLAVPGGAPDAVQSPAKPLEDLLAQAVAVAGGLARSGNEPSHSTPRANTPGWSGC